MSWDPITQTVGSLGIHTKIDFANRRVAECHGRHVHPSTLYPGGVGTVPTVQLLTDYLVRLMKYVEFMKKVVPLHDDLFDFFYEALPGYEEVGRRRILLGCWGSFQNPDVCDYTYKNMTKSGRAMDVTPGIVVDGQLVTTDLVEINLGIRILLGSSYYEDWQEGETFVRQDPLGNPVDQRHLWNQTTIPKPQKRDFKGNYTWVMSPRWYDKRTNDHLALDTGGGPRRAVAPCRHPGGQDRQLPPLPADPLERQPARHLRQRPAPTRTPCRTLRSSRRTAPTSSRGLTSCAPCAVLIRASRAASTCTWATAKCVRSSTPRCSASSKRSLCHRERL
jgi:hypothetical protein